MQSTNDIRQTFLNYFAKNGHEVLASGPLVPHNDPTLMFTNAGMVQFKNIFIGQETRDYSRAVTSQKCVRAGGKHNDLENVGYTARHHTFFEMLGNFSFGDYFKDLAIELAWNLVTKEFGLPEEKMLVTVYADDTQAFDLWKKISGLSDSRIIRISTSDNFWSMGDTGPCGPCSEIFFDHGDHIPGGPPGSVDEDGDRFIEIWNLVFMQFEQLSPNERMDLPKPSIDTGMGLERVSAVLQGTHDNYEIDLFNDLIQASADAADVPVDGNYGVSHRVITDHLRASSFLIADGVLPSNEGRGYVLRRIMRRAMRHVHLLGCTEPLMCNLVPTLTSQMGQAFPELIRAQALITETLELEERKFKRTLERGLKLLAEETAGLKEGEALGGEVAFKLYDTYGFPLDLTQDALRRDGYGIDLAGFDDGMERQKAEARAAWKGFGEAATEQVWFELNEQFGGTEFLGYDIEGAEGLVLALIVDGEVVDQAQQGMEVAVVLNQTPFYGESGGQEGDRGTILVGDTRVSVLDTQKKLGCIHVHIGTVSVGTLKTGENATLRIDIARRRSLRAHHSATHLLHSALRSKLGERVTQKGSLVAEKRLRFDVSYPKPITYDELSEVEYAVNRQISANTKVTTRLLTPDEAIEMGALALFGEKYGDQVRVVHMGDNGNQIYSNELCGGTHVNRTGDIGFFKIISEGAVAAGIRRIEAVTGMVAEAHIQNIQMILSNAASLLKVANTEVPKRIEALLEERRNMEKELATARRTLLTPRGHFDGGAADLKDVAGVKFVGRILEGIPPKDLKTLADDLKNQITSGVVALVTSNEGKASLVVAVTKDLLENFNAVDLARVGSEAVGGKGGGGRQDMAQAGGPNGSKSKNALVAIERAMSEQT